jgi:lipopolysaccharide export system permease protein
MSSLLQRYVIRSVLGQTLLVLMVLMTLSSVYLFITEQDDIGPGRTPRPMPCSKCC